MGLGTKHFSVFRDGVIEKETRAAQAFEPNEILGGLGRLPDLHLNFGHLDKHRIFDLSNSAVSLNIKSQFGGQVFVVKCRVCVAAFLVNLF